jgi:hypothetical protein
MLPTKRKSIPVNPRQSPSIPGMYAFAHQRTYRRPCWVGWGVAVSQSSWVGDAVLLDGHHGNHSGYFVEKRC